MVRRSQDGANVDPRQTRSDQKPQDRPSAAYMIAMRTFKPMTDALTRRDWHGVENLPKDGGFVACPNHISYIDPFAIATFLHDNGHPAYFLTKASVFNVPVIGWWMRSGGQVPVYRSSGRAGEALRGAVEAVRSGRCVVIMPESTLGRDPDLWPMVGKTGAARVALETRRPLIPIGQWGAQELLPPYGRPKPFPRKTMHVSAGPPVDLSDLYDVEPDSDVLQEATERLMAAITAEVARFRDEPPPQLRWDRALGRRVDPRAKHEPKTP
jgi:1-acyl-sn-glycerol-3-phosphate acyltransferase